MKQDCCSGNESTSQWRWVSIALCCTPGLIAVDIGIISIRFLGRPIMDLNTLVLLLVGLVCPIGMGLLMWMMNKNMNQSVDNLRKNDESPADLEDYLMHLRLQQQLLEDEIAELEGQHAAPGNNPIANQHTKPITIQTDGE